MNVLLLSSLLIFFRPVHSSGCGQRPPAMRIIGGETAVQNSWPWQVSVALGSRHICGGTLISPTWVVTSAHCISDFPFPELYQIIAGAHKLYGKTPVQQIVRVKELYIHQKYSEKTLKNDIGLIELETPVMFSSKVNAACLPQATDGEANKKNKCYITGWGNTETGKPAPYLKEALLTIVSHGQCQRKNKRYLPVDRKTMVCAGFRKKRGGCHGDSGGPLICEESGRWILRGAVSWGREDCSTKSYTVFARVKTFVPWIEDIMAGGDGEGVLGCSIKDAKICPRFKSFCSRNAAVRKMCPEMCDSCDEAEGNGNNVDCSGVFKACYKWKPRCHESIISHICSKVCKNLC